MDLNNIAALVGLAGGSLSGVKSITEIAKDIKDLVSKPNPDLSEINLRLVGLMDQLLAAKQAQMTLQNALLDLQREQQRLDRFSQEATRYQMAKTDMGGLVYTLKPGHENGEPPHDLCASCFQRGQKSILQRVGFNTLGCSQCNERVYRSDGTGQARTARIQAGWDVLDPYSGDD